RCILCQDRTDLEAMLHGLSPALQDPEVGGTGGWQSTVVQVHPMAAAGEHSGIQQHVCPQPARLVHTDEG
ncbi:MAG: hypothetical protein ACXVGB_10725, partial [Mycobacteriaceae bacterium]